MRADLTEDDATPRVQQTCRGVPNTLDEGEGFTGPLPFPRSPGQEERGPRMGSGIRLAPAIWRPMAEDRVVLVKQANDIVDVVGSYLALRPAGGTHKGLCPFHDDSRPSFDVDGRRQRYRCWSCGKHGD